MPPDYQVIGQQPYQVITTSGTQNIYVGQTAQTFDFTPPAPIPDATPLEWLRGQVDEICELAAAA